MTIVSADQLCVALEKVQRDHLIDTMAALGYVDDYDAIKTWQQLPTMEALSSATFPAIAVSTPGLVVAPSYNRSSNTYRATWRIAVGIYVRGVDHNDSAARVRNWAAGIRTTALNHKSLDGVAIGLRWAGEEYARAADRKAARTLAAGAVALDVTADVIADPTAGNLPPVLSTPTTVSVQ